MNYGFSNSMYPYTTNQPNVYNPYNNYYNNLQNQTTIIPQNPQGILPPNQQPTIIPPPVILTKTYLPKTYYEDIIDNLELVSLNMINDLKALKKNQRHMKVNRFDPNFLPDLKESIKDQFTEVEEFREKEKYKLTEEFKNAKNDIENFLREKFKPSQTIMENFKNELKKEKKVLTERLRDIEGTVKRENDEVETILLKSRDPLMRYAAERVYRPNEQSELDFAIMLKKKYAVTQEEKDIIDKDVQEKYPVIIEDKPIIIEELKQLEEKEREREEKGEEEDEEEFKEEDDDEEAKKKMEEQKVIDPQRKAKMLRQFRKIANVVIVSCKMIILRQLKIYSRIKDFSEILLTVEEYIDSMMEHILVKPIDTIERIQSKLDTSSRMQMNKIDDILKTIINTLIEKTTKVQINRTFSFFFRRYIFELDIVPPEYFSFFEKRRIKYIKGGDMNKQQQQFVLIMKVIINCLANEVLLSKAEDEDQIIGHNFKLIASIFYYSIIGYYREEIPLEEGVFDNSTAIINDNEEEGEEQSDYPGVDVHFKEQLISLDLLRKEERREVVELQKVNVKNIMTYSPDTMANDIEEITKLIFSYEHIRGYIENESSFYIINPLLAWSEKVIEIMGTHSFGFRV